MSPETGNHWVGGVSENVCSREKPVAVRGHETVATELLVLPLVRFTDNSTLCGCVTLGITAAENSDVFFVGAVAVAVMT